MESTEFDATIGGSEHLPFSANSLKFAAARSVEIAAMTQSILQPSKTKLIFQTLPVHMRRRVMSHNSRRLPQRLRVAHLEQLKKSGLPPKQKRPSRKYRRRPRNLLEEYTRRQKQNVWLETHIWHAKRFHMIERWNCRLAYAPCDKSFRACYRATSAHCLIQDMSYLTPISISGSFDAIKELLALVTSQKCGLGVCAQAYVNGYREGSVNIYKQNSFPFGFVGKVQFIWVPDLDSSNRRLWMFVHPSLSKEIEDILTNVVINKESDEPYEHIRKRQKTMNNIDNVEVKVWHGHFNRFRLTGPNSHAILVQSLKCVNENKINTDQWVTSNNINNLYLDNRNEYWNDLKTVKSAAELPPHAVIGLIVKDPRLSRPSIRTKAIQNTHQIPNIKKLLKVPPYVSTSPLWNISVCKSIKENILTNDQYVELITKSQLVPGELNEDNTKLQSVPVVLVQRPGSQDSEIKKIGYGCGWDIIIPSSYGLPFWLTFIMFGARAGGLRETENLYFEMGQSYLPPDSEAGKKEEQRIETELRNKYFRLPPSKRVNYLKLGINSPFICPWKVLLKDWSNTTVTNFFVMREREVLYMLQDCIAKKMPLPDIENCEFCLIPIFLKLTQKGTLRRHALICLSNKDDLKNIKTLFEPHHKDVNEDLRKKKRKEHVKEIKRLRRQRIKLRKYNKVIEKQKHHLKNEPSDYVKSMRELWLPSNIETVRGNGAREVMGFVSQGSFSFTEACACGVGYIAYNALNSLIKLNLNQVLIRNPTSTKYRMANIRIIND